MTISRLLAVLAGNATGSCDECTALYANATIPNPMCVAAANQSAFVQHCLDEDDTAGVFTSYMVFVRCTFGESFAAQAIKLVILVPWLLMLLIALGSTADNFLMPQLQILSDLLRLSPDVAGVTLLAIGNGAPDVFSAIAVATSNLGQKMDLSFMLSDIIGG